MDMTTDFSRVPAEEPDVPATVGRGQRFDVLTWALGRAAIVDADGDVGLADPLDHWDEVTR